MLLLTALNCLYASENIATKNYSNLIFVHFWLLLRNGVYWLRFNVHQIVNLVDAVADRIGRFFCVELFGQKMPQIRK